MVTSEPIPWRAEHLQNLIRKPNVINGQRCCELITKYLNLICNRRLPPNAASFVGASVLIALLKDTSNHTNNRPIAREDSFRKLSAHLILKITV
jgi:hypothetical protein